MLYSNYWQPSWVNKNNTLIQIYHISSYFIIYSMYPLLTFFHSSLQVLLADEDINFGEVYWGKIGTRSVTHQLYWHAMLYECQQQLYEFKKLIAVSVIHFYTLQPVLLGKVLWSEYVQQRLWDVFANCIYLHRRMGVNSSWVSVATLLYWLHLRIWDSDMQLLLLFTVKTRVLPVLTQTHYKAPLSSEAHTSKPTLKTQSEYN